MNLNISKEEADRLIRMYFDAYPKIEQYVKNSHRTAEWNQMIVTPFGQRKQQYGASPIFKGTAAYNASLRNSQNFTIQSTTSTAGLITFAQCAEGIQKHGGTAICSVYDSVEFSVPLHNAAAAIEDIFYYMDQWPVENFGWLDLPIGCDGELGLCWGDATSIHRGVTQAEIEAIIQKLQAAKVQR